VELSRPLPLILGRLAVALLTRLLTADEITRPAREAVQRWARGTVTRAARPQIEYLTTCPWCLSVYLGAGWAILVSTAPGLAMTAGAVLAWSEIAGLLAELT
jgi:hypothetical protein